MAAVITQEIPSQSFEVVRDRIGLILKEEIANQYVITNNPKINANVFSERFAPFDKSEFPAVNVLLSNANYTKSTVISDDGDYDFFIDVYASGRANNENRGDYNASRNLQKLMGICRSILRSPYYKNLGLSTPCIGSTQVVSMQVMEPKNNQDGTNAIWGRLVLKVKLGETVELQEAVSIGGWKTKVKLNLTDKGYLYEIN